MASYRDNQIPLATNYLKQFGGIREELAEAIVTKEHLTKLQLEAWAREQQLRKEIETLKSEREIYKKYVDNKMQELKNNIEQQKRSTDEMKTHLDEENSKLKRVIEELERELRKSRKSSKSSKDSKECIIA